MKANHIFFNLFPYRWKTAWYLNLLQIPKVIHRIFFTLIHGYPPQAQWDTYYWFICVMKEIIINYRYGRKGNWGRLTTEEQDKIYDHMLELLDKMDELSSIYDNVETEQQYKSMELAKEEFFQMFSKYFYNLWD